jgi:hypothetical protein
MNSLKNLTVASTSGVELPPVSGTPAPRCPSRLPSSLNRFKNGGEFTRSCKTAFAKHIFLVFTSPRARRRGNVAPSVGQEAGIEETMEGGAKCEELETEVTSASYDSDGVFGRDVGIGASVGAGAGVDVVDKI